MRWKFYGKSITNKNNCYDPGLQWKPHATLPNSYASAFQQFKKMRTRLEKDPNKLKRYQNTISCDLDKGYIRKLLLNPRRKCLSFFSPANSLFNSLNQKSIWSHFLGCLESVFKRFFVFNHDEMCFIFLKKLDVNRFQRFRMS